jgi:hypothetical protein
MNYGDSALNFPPAAPSCRRPRFTKAECPFQSCVWLISINVLPNHPTPPIADTSTMADFCAVRDRGFNGRKIIDEGVNIALKMPRSMRFMRHHCHLIRHAELVSA